MAAASLPRALDNFDGPFDLLLQLISQHRMDVPRWRCTASPTLPWPTSGAWQGLGPGPGHRIPGDRGDPVDMRRPGCCRPGRRRAQTLTSRCRPGPAVRAAAGLPGLPAGGCAVRGAGGGRAAPLPACGLAGTALPGPAARGDIGLTPEAFADLAGTVFTPKPENRWSTSTTSTRRGSRWPSTPGCCARCWPPGCGDVRRAGRDLHRDAAGGGPVPGPVQLYGSRRWPSIHPCVG